MSKLHELLAVDSNHANQVNQITQEMKNLLEKKTHHFSETRKTFKSSEEGAASVVEEQKEIQTTISKELRWFAQHFAKSLDVSHQIDVANTEATADVVVYDENETPTTLLRDVPTTTLLELEQRLAVFRGIIAQVPTLDPAKGFTVDPAKGKDVYKAREVTKSRTKKEQKPLILAPATDKHPAQVQLITEDVQIGTILEQEWSSLITPVTKSEMLERCDELIRSVKKARAKANEQEVDVKELKIGKKLLDYILTPLPA